MFKHAIHVAKRNKIKIAMSLSDIFCVTRHKQDFYNLLKNDLDILIGNENEMNELTDDEIDINLEITKANERMAKFGVLNTIDALAKEDILRWSEIEKLPYLTVLNKLIMDKEKHKIQQEIVELQRKQQTKN
jgi:sugar/nucleoside kinase (ribokinase family)